jgi:thioredoxin 2
MITQCRGCGKNNRVPPSAEGTPHCGNCHRPIAWIVDAGDDTFSDIVEKATIPVVVDFWAPWCAPCRIVSPLLEDLAHDLAGRIKLVKVNVDDAPKLADRFTVRHIPSLMVMNRGEQLAFRPGAAPKHELRPWIEEALNRRS